MSLNLDAPGTVTAAVIVSGAIVVAAIGYGVHRADQFEQFVTNATGAMATIAAEVRALDSRVDRTERDIERLQDKLP